MTNIQRIKQLDEQLIALEKIRKQGEFIGAGMTIGLKVGPQSFDEGPELTLTLCHNLPELLDVLKAGLQAARAENVLFAKRDLTALQDFFDLEAE